MMRYFKICLVWMFMIGLVSCASKSNKNYAEDYRDFPPLKVPQNVANFKIESHYPVPSLPKDSSNTGSVNRDQLTLPPKR